MDSAQRAALVALYAALCACCAFALPEPLRRSLRGASAELGRFLGAPEREH